MDADKVQQWAREADAYANTYGQYHAWDASFDKQAVRDDHFARLVRADALEEAAEICKELARVAYDPRQGEAVTAPTGLFDAPHLIGDAVDPDTSVVSAVGRSIVHHAIDSSPNGEL